MLDWQLYGEKAAGHHMTSVLWHAVNAVLAFLVMRRLTGAFWTSAWGAALFAWHPAARRVGLLGRERKDVMSGFFFLATLWAYAALRGAQGPAAEGMAPLRPGPPALPRRPHVQADAGHAAAPPARAGFLAPAPRRLMAGPRGREGAVPHPVGSHIGDHGCDAGGVGGVHAQAPVRRQGRQCVCLARPVRRQVPVALRPDRDLPAPGILARGPCGRRGAPRGRGNRRRMAPAPRAPVDPDRLALVPRDGPSRDWPCPGRLPGDGRPVHLPAHPRAAARPALDAPRGVVCARSRARPLAAAAVLVLAACAARTWNQEATWGDSVTLYRHAIGVTRRNDTAHALLGYTLAGMGRIDEAGDESRLALAINPRNEAALITLAAVEERRGRLEDAAADCRAILQVDPGKADIRFSLGLSSCGWSTFRRRRPACAGRWRPTPAWLRRTCGTRPPRCTTASRRTPSSAMRPPWRSTPRTPTPMSVSGSSSTGWDGRGNRWQACGALRSSIPPTRVRTGLWLTRLPRAAASPKRCRSTPGPSSSGRPTRAATRRTDSPSSSQTGAGRAYPSGRRPCGWIRSSRGSPSALRKIRQDASPDK